MKPKFPEILAPVGGAEQLVAAVKAGADAVYLAGRFFGARSSAQNFEDDELADAIRYCHRHGVSVYAAVNTLITDDEMPAALRFIDFLYRNDADAVIIQDLGLADAVRYFFPDLSLHASTQMTFHNVEGVRYAKQLGFSRVVLPREMPVGEIRRIAREVDIELEVFVHGALCVSYSGMCLLSSYIGGRSGNRGNCAQPCRKKYELYSTDPGRTYYAENRILSPKDLSVIEHLEELREIPKLSYKIEGRLKSYDYVYHVVSVYRRVLDGELRPDKACILLDKSYNRGYTEGFLFSADIVDLTSGPHPGHRGTPIGTVVSCSGGRLSIRLTDRLVKGDEIQHRFPDGSSVGARADRIFRGAAAVDSAEAGEVVSIPFRHRLSAGSALYKTYDAAHVASVDAQLNREYKPWRIAVHAECRIGKPLRMSAVLGELRVEAAGAPVESAAGNGTDRGRIVAQLSRLGGTPFEIDPERSTFDVDPGCFVPIGALNAVRREVAERLGKLLETRYPARRSAADRIRKGMPEQSAGHPPAAGESVLRLPALIDSDAWDCWQKHVDVASAVQIAHVSQLAFRNLAGKHLSSAHTLNVMNSRAIGFLRRAGVGQIELSTEIDDSWISTPGDGEDSGLVEVQTGPIALMRMAYCPVGAQFGGGKKCGLCSTHRFAVRDEAGVEYRLGLDPTVCRATLLSPGESRKGKKMKR